MVVAKALRRCSGRLVDGDRHPKRRKQRVQQRDVDVLTTTRPLPFGEREENALKCEEACEVIGDGDADFRGLAVWKPGDRHETRLGLNHGVISGSVGVRPGRAIARNRAVDQPGMERVHLFVPEPESIETAGPEVLDQHVGGHQKAPEHFLALGHPQVQRDALLVSVHRDEVGAPPVHEWWKRARIVARSRLLDLDHLGAHVRHEHRAIRSRENAREIDDLQP